MITTCGKYFLYRHIRLDKNETFYIGIGTKKSYIKKWSVKSAYYRAYEKGNRNPIWKNIVKKTNYRVEIVFESDDYEWIKNREIAFIKLYGRINNNSGTLANLTDGGEGVLGIIVTDSTRTKMSIAKKGKTSPHKGKKMHSKETKDYISSIQKGNKLRLESIQKRTKTRLKNALEKGEYHSQDSKDKIGRSNSKRVFCRKIGDKEILEYDSCHDVNRKVGFPYSTISVHCKNNTIYKGFQWSYTKEIFKNKN